MAKWIEFIDAGESESGKTRLWHVCPPGQSPIGIVHWYGPWRKYCYSPHANTVYEQDCLRDIAAFCEERTKDHKANKVV